MNSGETTECACTREEVICWVFSAETKFDCVALHRSEGAIWDGWERVVLGW